MTAIPPPFTWIEWVIIALIGGIILVLLASCGTTTDRQTKTVEKQEWVAGPMVIDTWLGTVTVQPTRVVHQRVEDEVEKTEKTINAPDPTPFITAAVGGGIGPLGIAGSILGLITTTATAWKAKRLGEKATTIERQRDEVVDGVERSKQVLPPEHWKALTASLEAEQSRDTKEAIRERTA